MRALRNVIVTVLLLFSLSVHAQPSAAPQAPVASAPSEDRDQSIRKIINGGVLTAAGAATSLGGLLMPVAAAVFSAVAWNDHRATFNGANVELPGFGGPGAPTLGLGGLQLQGAFAVLALTAVPALVLVTTGLVFAVAGVSLIGRGIAGVTQPSVDDDAMTSPVRTEARWVGAFRRIRIEGGAYKVLVKQGEVTSLHVTAPEHRLPTIMTRVDGDTLVVESRDGFRLSDQPVRLEVITPHLEDLELAGAGELVVQGVTAETLRVAVSGAGKVDVDAAVRSLVIELSGAGAADVRGSAEALRAELSGTGALDAGNLRVQRATVEVAGAGQATVAPTDLLDASISGVGQVRYKGEPKEIREHVSGLGKVRKD